MTTFNIKVTMKERWIDDFCSMLKQMESCGQLGHSALVAFYADGDGDFRPKFEIDYPYTMKDGFRGERIISSSIPEVIYDAG